MNSKLRPFVAAGLLATAAGLLNSGCVDNDATLFIQGVMKREPPECVVKADPGAVMIRAGSLDVAFRSAYRATLLVGNQYTPRGDKENLRAETTRVILRGAEVTLTDAEGNAIECTGTAAQCSSFSNEFSVVGSGFADSARGTAPGYGVFNADLIPESVGASLAAEINGSQTTKTVVATVRVFGETTGGQEIESGELTYPITVCYGCLVDFPTPAMDPLTGRCDEALDQIPDDGCYRGQDDAVDCRACGSPALSTHDLCRGPDLPPP